MKYVITELIKSLNKIIWSQVNIYFIKYRIKSFEEDNKKILESKENEKNIS